jgi:hypothetical protein
VQEPSVVADFRSDWVAFLRSALVKAGYSIEPDTKQDRVSIMFFNVLRRRIAKRPREVFKAAEFSCPDRLAPGLARFVEEAQRGSDLMPRQGKELLDADSDDGLLNHWDVHHFHLGIERDPNAPRFVRRTDYLLYARVTDDAVYMLDVAKHGAWFEQRFVEIMHRNWPASLERYRLLGVTGPVRRISDKDVASLRPAGVDVMTQVSDGTVYAIIGGGIATSGTNIQVVRQSDYYFERIHRLEESVRASANDILAEVNRRGLFVSDPLHLELLIDWRVVRVVEARTRYVVRLLETWGK